MILRCPHCTSVHILVNGEPDADVCTRPFCRGIMERLTDETAINGAIRAALDAYEHGSDKS